jgi:hypothetical protein
MSWHEAPTSGVGNTHTRAFGAFISTTATFFAVKVGTDDNGNGVYSVTAIGYVDGTGSESLSTEYRWLNMPYVRDAIRTIDPSVSSVSMYGYAPIDYPAFVSSSPSSVGYSGLLVGQIGTDHLQIGRIYTLDGEFVGWDLSSIVPGYFRFTGTFIGYRS